MRHDAPGGGGTSGGSIPAGAFAVTWQKRGMKTEWKRVVEKDKYGRKQMDRKKTRSMEVRGGRCYGGYGNDGRRGYGEGRRRRHGVKVENESKR